MDNVLTGKIIECSIAVHRELGPGLLESAYENCLAYEFEVNGINYKKQLELPVVYKGVNVDCGYRLDLLVENKVIIELKSVTELSPIHSAQLLTYMKLSNKNIGLLINFNVVLLKNGIKRMVL